MSTTHRVCHRLISSWKSDLNVSLAALELLSGLARIHIKESGKMKLGFVSLFVRVLRAFPFFLFRGFGIEKGREMAVRIRGDSMQATSPGSFQRFAQHHRRRFFLSFGLAGRTSLFVKR